MVHDVVAALLVRDARVLLCHRTPGREWYPNVWDLPGGHVENGETGADALVRELAEELGIVADVPVAEPVVVAVEGDLRLRIWRLDTWRAEPVNRCPEEHDAIAWFGADDLAGLALAHPSYAEMIEDVLASPT